MTTGLNTGKVSTAPMPLLMSVNDFCQRFSIGRTKFYDEVKRGTLKITKVRGSTRVAVEDALAWRNHYRNTDPAA
jgi:hypothetical protein